MLNQNLNLKGFEKVFNEEMLLKDIISKKEYILNYCPVILTGDISFYPKVVEYCEKRYEEQMKMSGGYQ